MRSSRDQAVAPPDGRVTGRWLENSRRLLYCKAARSQHVIHFVRNLRLKKQSSIADVASTNMEGVRSWSFNSQNSTHTQRPSAPLAGIYERRADFAKAGIVLRRLRQRRSRKNRPLDALEQSSRMPEQNYHNSNRPTARTGIRYPHVPWSVLLSLSMPHGTARRHNESTCHVLPRPMRIGANSRIGIAGCSDSEEADMDGRRARHLLDGPSRIAPNGLVPQRACRRRLQHNADLCGTKEAFSS